MKYAIKEYWHLLFFKIPNNKVIMLNKSTNEYWRISNSINKFWPFNTFKEAEDYILTINNMSDKELGKIFDDYENDIIQLLLRYNFTKEEYMEGFNKVIEKLYKD